MSTSLFFKLDILVEIEYSKIEVTRVFYGIYGKISKYRARQVSLKLGTSGPGNFIRAHEPKGNTHDKVE
jgi:hypothetical protein